MSETSRRNFIAAAGFGAAAVGTVTIAGSADAATPTAKSAKQPVIVLLDDHRTDKLSMMVGDREVVVHDRALVQRILNAAGGK